MERSVLIFNLKKNKCKGMLLINVLMAIYFTIKASNAWQRFHYTVENLSP